MRATFSNSRCLPPEKTAVRATLRLPVRRSATLAGRRGEPPHVFIDVRKRRLDFLIPAALAEASEAACASTTSAKRCFYEHDYGPREHPRPPDVVGTTARSIESRLSIAGNRRSYAGPGVEKPNLDAHHRDCSRRGLRPNPDRFGHLVSRAPSFALSGETRGRGRVRRHRACLHRKRNERVVRRPTSAKKSDVHQPEGPSVEGPSRRTVENSRTA